MLSIKERLNNTQIVRVYRHMIEYAPIETVLDLRKKLYEKASDHPRLQDLEIFFKKRLGE